VNAPKHSSEELAADRYSHTVRHVRVVMDTGAEERDRLVDDVVRSHDKVVEVAPAEFLHHRKCTRMVCVVLGEEGKAEARVDEDHSLGFL
jgi:hypothetical protein